MTYFRVDDKLHDHKKTRRARKGTDRPRDTAAMGLWVLAGSWCMANGSDGFVPTDELDRWDTNGEQLAERLVDAELWHRHVQDGEDGYLFHEWDEWQHSVEYLEQRRRRNADRMRTKRANAQAADLQEQPVRAHGADTARTVLSTPTTTQPNNTPAAAAADSFDAFWATYPRKVGRAVATKAWAKALRDTDAETVLAGLRNAVQVWTATGTEPRFIPHPSTWLNAGRWADEVPLPGMPTTPANRPATLAQCTSTEVHERHPWADARNRFQCMGVDL